MNYLRKNAKGLGMLIFLLAVMAFVNYALTQKEQKVQQRMEIILPTMLMNIKNSCMTTGTIKIDGVVFTCIPREAV